MMKLRLQELLSKRFQWTCQINKYNQNECKIHVKQQFNIQYLQKQKTYYKKQELIHILVFLGRIKQFVIKIHKQRINRLSIKLQINLILFIVVMGQRSQTNFKVAQQTENEHEHEEEPFSPKKQQMRQQNIQYQSLAVFAILIAVVILFKVFTTYDDDVKNGKFYQDHIMSFELIDFWKMTDEKLAEEQADKQKKIIQQNQHAITRQQLGHQSWSLLHMITGGFPQTFDDNLRKKFNAFLVLFGQMYPCKMCANHFMQLLRKQGLFQGNTKKQLMEYLCKIHNKVNERLGHPIHDCSKVVQQWNTCGCSGAPNG